MAEQRKRCFVIAPIGTDGSLDRKRSDEAFQYIFCRALEPLGYDLERADHISAPGIITRQVVQRILDDDLVLADLTDHNPNVFYELAVRHAVGKPVVHVIHTGQEIPFDIHDMRTIFYALGVADAERATKGISDQVKEIEKGHVGETPIKLASALKVLDGRDPRDAALREIMLSIESLRSELRPDFARIPAAFTQQDVDEAEGITKAQLLDELTGELRKKFSHEIRLKTRR